MSGVLEEVAYDGGTMAGKSFRGRMLYSDDDPLPMLSVLEPPIPLDVLFSKGDNPNSTGMWELLVQGFVKDDPENPTDPAHHLMATTKARLVQEKRRDRGMNIFGMGGRVVEMFIGQGSVRPADDVSHRAFFWLTLTLRLVENLEDAYE
ncbi:hypothetical protein [Neoaquamicrobium sediminum]|uniref:hypothetical protein n=1 Tax=Neoaquamicrobium sediminum TaxID=1849104 RepID=UPI0019D67325|nr:hypothetical protein [Mesorhizobium sediminum]